jgi:hypothetical protein
MTVESMAAMLNFEIDDHPVYSGCEIQRFEDPIHGPGTAVLLMRRESRQADVYRQPGLRLDPASYAIGGGLGAWREAEIEPARLEVTATGVVAQVGLRDADGRDIAIAIDDRDGRPRDPGSLLAPIGAGIERPTSMLLVWMPRFDLVRMTGPEFSIRIDGRPVMIGRLPGARLHRRRLVKYAADLAVVRLNPDPEGAPSTLINAFGARIDGVVARQDGHEARLELEPPLPDLAGMPDRSVSEGSWRLGIDHAASVVAGSWSARRDDRSVELVMDSTAEWRPGPLPLLMRLVTRIVPTFRRWPTTYRWLATIRLDDPPSLTSRWERTGPGRDESYQRFTSARSS